jgi:uncharacterized iron-regulated protein
MFDLSLRFARAGLCAIALPAALILLAAPARAADNCAPAGQWTVPGGGRIAAQEILARAAKARVVLLGESHDDTDHHRWELQTVAALAALRPKIVLGFEMFPRRVQGALERWVGGELGEDQFLRESDWSRVWGFDAGYYLPLFHFARINRVPMLALNVERDLVRAVGANGFAAMPVDKREGVSAPAPARASYVERLFDVYVQHPDKKDSAPKRTDAEFLRFVEAQLVWDRAMAQVLVDAALRDPDVLAIGIMGSRHIAHGEGVVHQIESLGLKSIVSLLPWDAGDDCSKFTPDLASAVFGLPAVVHSSAPQPERPRLGIHIRTAPDGVLISAVEAGSIAESTGLRVDDVLVEVAGTSVKTADEVKAFVGRMAPGTWLPLKVKRKIELVELTAKFPTQK